MKHAQAFRGDLIPALNPPDRCQITDAEHCALHLYIIDNEAAAIVSVVNVSQHGYCCWKDCLTVITLTLLS